MCTHKKDSLACDSTHPACAAAGNAETEDFSALIDPKFPDEVAYDERHPTYNGGWTKAVPTEDTDIATDSLDEPHLKRRAAILARYPDIEKLNGVEPLTKYVAVALVVTQIATTYLWGHYMGGWSNWWMVLCAYTVGASIVQASGVILHECCHSLCFKSPLANRMLGLFVNLSLVVPIAASFRRYHLEHHAFQGVKGKDPDLPLAFEYKLIHNNPLAKSLWIFCYPVWYLVRSIALKKKPTAWEIYNVILTLMWDVVIWKTCTARGFAYMALSLWLGYGVHPAAAHFIQEHYTFDDGQETYSYYGILNHLFMNIGYHNEHHDFTRVPWTKLPSITARAPEFYKTINYHTSWVMVHINFIFRRDVGPISRVGRSMEDHKKGRKQLLHPGRVRYQRDAAATTTAASYVVKSSRVAASTTAAATSKLASSLLPKVSLVVADAQTLASPSEMVPVPVEHVDQAELHRRNVAVPAR
ncbi:hypothetical protein CXG81DRAFT_9381 [Caulochytrium protostelioides]|uniref:Sphingolipid delta4-desaturase N-terminal domain-containing protein n=1 Tax=Caulochytrium protostelioides TaxID=1555241 RepID=A0A4P9XDJ4_9FUNG|nr:hypothetical protein CXG81DRAFT_9381 [Caulochytrium protostelioides]|eukprot:RKP03587.1 hypothetical protein CXG81DRAFT_9381 [Caulochytrium protostelioides]